MHWLRLVAQCLLLHIHIYLTIQKPLLPRGEARHDPRALADVAQLLGPKPGELEPVADELLQEDAVGGVGAEGELGGDALLHLQARLAVAQDVSH